MDFLGIGPLELAFILLIALIVLGPKDMVKAGKTIGRVLRNIVTSDNWRTIQQASKEVRDLPNRLIREAGLEDIQNQLPETESIHRKIGLDDLTKEVEEAKGDLADWTTPPADPESGPVTPILDDPLSDDPLLAASPGADESVGESAQDAPTPPVESDESHKSDGDIADIGTISPPKINNDPDPTESP